MKRGDVIKVRAFGNEVLKRRVVAVYDNVVAICRDEEFKQAEKEKREPNVVGFKVTDVLEVFEVKRATPKPKKRYRR